MQPLILNYTESTADDLTIPELEYDGTLQLNVLKGTKVPAFNAALFRTDTFTKANGEPTEDDDRSPLSAGLYTVTHSAADNEMDDSDRDVVKQFLQHAGTMTNTRTQMESTDSDN